MQNNQNNQNLQNNPAGTQKVQPIQNSPLNPLPIKVGIDIGYYGTKVYYLGKMYQLPTAISFHHRTGIEYGDVTYIDYENEHLHIGEAAVSDDSFATTDYKLKRKYDPAIIYHVLKQLGLAEEAKKGRIQLHVGLALVDWKYKKEYLERIGSVDIDNINLVFNNIKIIPQGAGAYIYFMKTMQNEEIPYNVSIVDIGYNTINFLYFEDNKVQNQYCKAFPGHGVSGIIRKITNFIQAKTGMKFSEQQVHKIFIRGKFSLSGVDQQDVSDEIIKLKTEFIKQLFGSILTSEKKILATSEKVIFTGGGCYLLENVPFPANWGFIPGKNYEFNNVRGYVNE